MYYIIHLLLNRFYLFYYWFIDLLATINSLFQQKDLSPSKVLVPCTTCSATSPLVLDSRTTTSHSSPGDKTSPRNATNTAYVYPSCDGQLTDASTTTYLVTSMCDNHLIQSSCCIGKPCCDSVSSTSNSPPNSTSPPSSSSAPRSEHTSGNPFTSTGQIDSSRYTTCAYTVQNQPATSTLPTSFTSKCQQSCTQTATVSKRHRSPTLTTSSPSPTHMHPCDVLMWGQGLVGQAASSGQTVVVDYAGSRSTACSSGDNSTCQSESSATTVSSTGHAQSTRPSSTHSHQHHSSSATINSPSNNNNNNNNTSFCGPTSSVLCMPVFDTEKHGKVVAVLRAVKKSPDSRAKFTEDDHKVTQFSRPRQNYITIHVTRYIQSFISSRYYD